MSLKSVDSLPALFLAIVGGNLNKRHNTQKIKGKTINEKEVCGCPKIERCHGEIKQITKITMFPHGFLGRD